MLYMTLAILVLNFPLNLPYDKFDIKGDTLLERTHLVGNFIGKLC